MYELTKKEEDLPIKLTLKKFVFFSIDSHTIVLSMLDWFGFDINEILI